MPSGGDVEKNGGSRNGEMKGERWGGWCGSREAQGRGNGRRGGGGGGRGTELTSIGIENKIMNVVFGQDNHEGRQRIREKGTCLLQRYIMLI